MSKVAILILMPSFLAYGHAAYAAERQDVKCGDATIWEVSDPETTRSLKIERIKAERAKATSVPSNKNGLPYKFEYNKSKPAYFIEPGKKYAEIIVIVQGAKQALRITVPDWKHRPLDAHWVNKRVLAIETGINPHTSIYWEYDIKSQKILNSKIGRDDLDALRRCQNNE